MEGFRFSMNQWPQVPEAEPLAETAPVEEVSGAALASSGLFIPGPLDKQSSSG